MGIHRETGRQAGRLAGRQADRQKYRYIDKDDTRASRWDKDIKVTQIHHVRWDKDINVGRGHQGDPMTSRCDSRTQRFGH